LLGSFHCMLPLESMRKSASWSTLERFVEFVDTRAFAVTSNSPSSPNTAVTFGPTRSASSVAFPFPSESAAASRSQDTERSVELASRFTWAERSMLSPSTIDWSAPASTDRQGTMEKGAGPGRFPSMSAKLNTA